MFAPIIFLLVLGILIVIHEFGHFWVAKKIGVKVEEFSLGFGKKLLKRKKGETEYSLSVFPLGGYVKMSGDERAEFKGGEREYLAQAPGKRALIVLAGPAANYILGIICFWLIFTFGYPTFTTKVGKVLEGYGAEAVGIKAGDSILAIDNKEIKLWEELQDEILSKNKSTVEVKFKRGEEILSVNVSLTNNEVKNILGEKKRVGMLGISPSDETVVVRHGAITSFGLAVKKSYDLTILTYKALWRIVSGKLSFRDSVSGPLGIYYVTTKTASLGVGALVQLLAVLSISLAIFNLLPLPVLDGGHIFLLGIEKIRKKALNQKAELVITRIGISLMVTLAIFATYNDFLRIFKDKIDKFIH